MSILDGIQLLGDLSDKERNELSMFCQEKHLDKGDILFKQDEEATAMYLLKEGSVEISRYSNGTDMVIGEVHSEEILGEMALFGDSNKRMATAKALNDCDLIVILSFSIKELTSKHEKLMDKIKEIINLRLISNKNI